MRTVNFIQFTNVQELEYGFMPEENKFYKVNFLTDQYTYELEDENGDLYEETLDSISIEVIGRTRHVTGPNRLDYNLLTIVLDEKSQLFK